MNHSDLRKFCAVVSDTLVGEIGNDAVSLIEKLTDEEVSRVWWDIKKTLYPPGYMSKVDIKALRPFPVDINNIVELLLRKTTVLPKNV